MGWHDGLPSRATVAQLLRRAFSLAVVAFGLIGCGVLAHEYVERHDASSDIATYAGWQVDLALAGLGLIGVVLIGSGAVGLRRFRLLPRTPVSFQVLAAFIAIIIGGAAAAQFHREPERVVNWAAGHTAAARADDARDAQLRHLILGDASHPPQPFGIPSTAPAPPFATAQLLRARDLGPEWHLQGPAKGYFLTHDPATELAGLRSSANIPIADEIWNGHVWVQHLAVFETLRRFHSAAQARRDTAQQISDATATASATPGSKQVTHSQVDGVTVWQTFPSSTATSVRAFFSVGTSALEVSMIPPVYNTALAPPSPMPTFTVITHRQIVTAAIKRAETTR